MTPIQTYRITSNFIEKRGIDHLQQLELDLNKGISIDRIALSLLHCSERRAYVLREAMFCQVFILRESARECVENYVKSDRAKIERAIKFSQQNVENKRMRFILCNQYQKSESVSGENDGSCS